MIYKRSSMTALALLAVSVSVSAPATVLAQSAPTAAAGDKLEEVVVTARRAAEHLQDIPVSVQVVSGDSLQKMAITSVEEVSKLAPGLTLINAGTSTAVVLRGVTWQPGSGTPATPIYFNEVPFDPQQTIVSMFDMGQVEVLRGPQGTTRGAPSISGAVTLTTQRPNLRASGGYVQGSYGSGKHSDLQVAVNYPIIANELAVRLATNIEDSEGSRISSVNRNIKPSVKDRSYRVTALWQPSEALSFQGMYQQRETMTQTYTQVAGTGSPGFPGFPGALPAVPANFNGPALSVADRASVQDQPYSLDQHVDLLTFNAGWEVLGHQLSYNFGRQYNRSPLNYNAADPLNILPGFEVFQSFGFPYGVANWKTHELRLSSLASPDRRFDYDIGWYAKRSGSTYNYDSPTYLTGAFGHPLTAGPGAVTSPNPRYVLNSSTNIGLGQDFESYHGNIRFRLTDRDELSVGLASVKDRVPVDVDIKTFAASNAFADPRLPARAACPFAAPGAIASPVYTSGVICEANLPDGFRNSSQHNNDSYTDTLYNLSLSHKFSDDLLAYVTSGSSFRTGLPAINNPGLPGNLTTPKPEKAKSYEVGVKSSLGSKLRINAALFQLDYQNQLTSFEGVQYFNSVAAAPAQTSLAFYSNIDAKVQGAEFEIAAKPIEHLTLGANLSYSSIKSKGGRVPCTDPTQAAISAANPINFCASPVGQKLNTQAPFQAIFNGSYEVPLANAMSAYFRFNANYKGDNPNFGNFRTGTTFRNTPSYTVVDLFAGVTGQKGSWDLGLYAKNVFDKQVELARVATINSVYTNFRAPAGYDVVRTSLPREVGVKLRYAFGSR